MDTSPLEEKIKAIEQEIADRQAKIELLKIQIDTDKKVLKEYQRGLEKIKGKCPQ